MVCWAFMVSYIYCVLFVVCTYVYVQMYNALIALWLLSDWSLTWPRKMKIYCSRQTCAGKTDRQRVIREHSESNQRAIREHSENNPSIKIRVIQQEPVSTSSCLWIIYTFVKSLTRFQVGDNSRGFLVNQYFGVNFTPGEKAATLLLGCVPANPHIA